MSSTPNPAIVKVTTPTTINVSDLTSGTVDGSGVFDQLMRGVNAQLDKQFKADRITGSEYAAIYTEAIKQVLATSTSVLFEKAKQAYELTLLDLQVDAERENIKLTKLSQEKSRRDTALVEREMTRVDAQIDILSYELRNKLPVEVNNIVKQGLILDSQKANSDSQLLTLSLQREVIEVEKDTAIYRLSSVMPVELANIGKQGDLFDQELLSKPVERSLLEAEGLIKDKQLDVMDSQIAGQVSQNALYDQKTLSERANVDGSVIGTGSLFDKQRQLLIEQHETFIKDAKQKVAKMMIDTWGIRFTEDPGAAAVGLSGLHDTNIKLAVEELLRSIDVVPNTYVPPPTTP